MVRKAARMTNERHVEQSPMQRIAQSIPQPAEDLIAYGRQYARKKPEVVALWCLGIGFILGWKLKPW